MPARRNRKDKHGTGVHLDSRERYFVLTVFTEAGSLVRFDERFGTVYYFRGFLNGYLDVIRGLRTRGLLEEVLPTKPPDYVSGDMGRQEAVLGLTERGRAAWAVAFADEAPRDPVGANWFTEP